MNCLTKRPRVCTNVAGPEFSHLPARQGHCIDCSRAAGCLRHCAACGFTEALRIVETRSIRSRRTRRISILAEPYFLGAHDESDVVTLERKKGLLELARGRSRIFPEAPTIAWCVIRAEQGIGQ